MAKVAVVPRQPRLEVRVGERSPAAPTEVAVAVVVVVVVAANRLLYSFFFSNDSSWARSRLQQRAPGVATVALRLIAFGAVHSRPATDRNHRAGARARNARPASNSLVHLRLDWRLRRGAS